MSNPAKQSGECQACLENNELIVLPCGHALFCSGCTIRRFSNITESRPATCLVCSSAVPLDSVKSILPEDLYAKIEADLHEWSVPGLQRLYCPNTACTKFIHPSNYQGHQCPFCAVKICTCKCLAHEGEYVDSFKETREFVDPANSKQCSVCGNLVERHQGCQHMICVKCDHHFCILCARDWNLCRASCEGSTADANINHGEPTETIRSLLNRLLVAMVMGQLPFDAKLVKSNAAKDEQIKKLEAEVTVARQVERIAKEEEQKSAELTKTLREQLADAELISAPTEGDATAAGPELQKVRKELIAARRLEEINKKGHEEALKLKDKQIEDLTAGQDFALQAETFAKKKQREVEAKLKKYEQKSQGKVVTSGTVVELTDAELGIITNLESDNKELREQLSKMEADLMASRNDAVASKLQGVSLRQQLEISKIETSATSEPSASTTSGDSATNARVSALESDNKTLQDQAIQTQAELSTARSTEQEAVKEKLEIETQTQTLQTELDDLKNSASQQPSQSLENESVSKLEIQVQALNIQVAQHQVDLNAARVAEQVAISRETAAVTESEDLRSQLTAAQKKARPHDTMDIAVAVQTSGLVAEKKDLREQLSKTREELSAAYLAEQTAVASVDSMAIRLETAVTDIQKLRERLDLTSSETSEKEKAAETTKTATSEDTSPAETTTTVAAADQTDIEALRDRISQLEKELQSSRDSVEAAKANQVPPHEDVSKLQSEVERLSRQISLTTSQEAAARLAEDKAIERAATAKSDAESLRSEVVFLRESVSRTQREQIPLREKIDKADELLRQKDSIIRRYQQRHIAGTHTNNATSETEEMTAGQEKKATVYIRYRNPEEVAALEKQIQDAQAKQKVAQDEAARLRVDLDKKTTATTAEASTTKSEINIEILKLRIEVDELKTKLNNTAKSSAKEGEPNSDPSRTLLEGQLIFAKALLKSSENEKANSIAETIRLRKELATYKQFEVDVSNTVLKGRKDFETLEAQLRKTKKQLRKYTGDVKKPKETTAGAVEETSKPKTKASHLLIQTTQLATLKEKDKQIEDIRLAAGWAHTKLTKTIVAQNDEIRKLKKNMKLPSHASKALTTPSTVSLPKPEQWVQLLQMVTGPTQPTSSVPEPDQKAHDGGTPIVYAQPAPHLLHIPSKDVQTTIDAEIAQSRQAFEEIRLKRANAFSSWQLEQAGQPHREKAWETLEKETFKEQQDLREELQVSKEALIRKARLAEDQLQTSLKLKKQQEAARAASEEQAKPVTVDWDASSSEALKEALAEARQGKQKMQPKVEETWGEARTTRSASPPEAHKETLLGQQEEVAPTASKEQVKPPTGELRASASETIRRMMAEARRRQQKWQPMVEGIPDEEL